MKTRKLLSLALAAALVLTALTGCGGKAGSSGSSGSAASGSASAAGSASGTAGSASGQPDASGDASASGSYTLPDLAVLSGPTGVGAAKLLYDLDAIASYTVAAENTEVTAALTNGDVDIACIATNVAANLAAKTEGGIQVLAVNTLGVLYILEKGDTVHAMADLAGKTLYAPSTARGANPEYILNKLLTASGVEPAQVDIQWLTPQEITAQITSSDAGICMLPVPAATALLVQDSGVRQAISLSDEWENQGLGALPMGCVVARTDYIEANPDGVTAFLKAYEESIAYMNDEANREDAGKLAADLGIVPNPKVGAAAIPQCSLTFLTGEDMKLALESYYQVLFQADPASIGGALPYDSFYYGVG